MPSAFILVTCDNRKNMYVEEQLREMHGIKNAKKVHGAYDCIAETENMKSEEIRKLVRYNIRPMRDVRSALTLKKFNQE